MKLPSIRLPLSAFCLLCCFCLLAFTGCQNTGPIAKSLYVTSVSTGVALGVRRYPETKLYLQVATPIICAQASSTNVTPEQIIAALGNSPEATAAATPQGKLILNGALVLYFGIFDAIGIKDMPTLQNYLGWTCEALTLGLPPADKLRLNVNGRYLP